MTSGGAPLELDHLNLWVRDVARSAAFYRALLEPLGWRMLRDFGDVAVGFGTGDYAVLALVRADGAVQPTHLAFRVAERAQVDALHRAALAAGGRDNGAPGLRPHYHASYYAGFALDPDGHNLEVVCHHPQDAGRIGHGG